MKSEGGSCNHQVLFFTHETGKHILTFHNAFMLLLLSSGSYEHSLEVESADVISDLIKTVLYSKVP